MSKCLHLRFESANEWRFVPGCRKRNGKPVLQEVFKCLDCEVYFAGTARREVPPPPPFAVIFAGVVRGRLSPLEAVQRYGYLTPDERKRISAIEPHEHEMVPMFVIVRCKVCGRQVTRPVEGTKQMNEPKS